MATDLATFGQTCDILQISQLDEDDITEAVKILKPKTLITSAPFNVANLEFEGVTKLCIRMRPSETRPYLDEDDLIDLLRKREELEISCLILPLERTPESFIRNMSVANAPCPFGAIGQERKKMREIAENLKKLLHIGENAQTENCVPAEESNVEPKAVENINFNGLPPISLDTSSDAYEDDGYLADDEMDDG